MTSPKTTITTNDDGTTTYTFTITTDTPSRVKDELLASAGFTNWELCSQLRWRVEGKGACCLYEIEDVMDFLETSSEEEAKAWWDDHGGSWECLEEEFHDTYWNYIDSLV